MESVPGQYNWLYYDLKKMYPDWTEDQLVRAAYPRFFAERDQEQKNRQAQDDAATAQYIQTGAQVVGAPAGIYAGKQLAGLVDGKGAEAAATTAAPEAAAAATPEASGALTEALASGGALPAYIYAPIALQTALSAKSAYDMLQGKEKRLDQMRLSDITEDPTGIAGRVGLGIATGGLSEIGNSLLSHKSTKQYQNERRNALLNRGLTGLQNFEQQSEAQNGSIYRDPNASSDPTAWDYLSSLGNYETFGNDWNKYNLDQKAKITQALMDAGMYRNDHGDVLIQHGLGEGGDRAKQIAADVLAGKLNVDPGANPYMQKPQAAPATIETAANRSGLAWDPLTHTWKPRSENQNRLAQALAL